MAGMTRFDIEPAYACLSCMRQVPSFEVWQRHTERGLVFTHHAADGHPVVRIVFREQQAQAPPASDPPGLASLTRSLCEALWDMQSSPDCWCPHDRAVTEPHTEACAAARAVNGAAKRFHLYDELPLPASPQAKED